MRVKTCQAGSVTAQLDTENRIDGFGKRMVQIGWELNIWMCF